MRDAMWITPLRSLVLTLACIGCGPCSNQAPAGKAAATAAKEAAPQRAKQAKPQYFAADGALLPSNTVHSGLVMPRGLEVFRDAETRHVYRSKVPMKALFAYFGPLLLTADIEHIGAGAIYKQAKPRNAKGSSVTVDVSIMPWPRGQSRVEVIEHRATMVRSPLPAETLQEMTRNTFRYLD